LLLAAGAGHQIRNKQGRRPGDDVRNAQLQAVFDELAE